MSLASIATNLYTIQSKRNVPFKTAFSMMVREDMAMRFSVYNLVRIVTKSEFLATVAQTAYGKRTPLQKMQDEEERKAAEKEKQFKVYTQVTFARINNRLNLLTNIAERNFKLISNLYMEMGYFRGQRRMSVNAGTITATRIPGLSKTIKGRIDELQAEVQSLKKAAKKPTGRKVRGMTSKKKSTKNETDAELDLSQIALSKLLRFVPGIAAGLGTIMGISQLPGITERVGKRFGGGVGAINPAAEETLQELDPKLAAISAAGLTATTLKGAQYLKGRFGKKESAIQTLNRLTKTYQSKGMSYREAQREAGAKASRYKKLMNPTQAKKWMKLLPTLRGLGKLAPTLAAADIAFEISRMSNYVSDHSIGKMNDADFEKNMTASYGQLISTVGVGGISTAIGAIAGTALFPGLGTFGLAAVGAGVGAILSMALQEDGEFKSDNLEALANKVFKLLHDDESRARASKPSVAVEASQKGLMNKGETKNMSFMDQFRSFMGYDRGVGETIDASRAMDFFIEKGWTPQQAAGIVGNLQQESGPNLSTNAVGDGGSAYGIAQWHPDRQARFAEVFGKDIRQSTMQEQLAFVQWELMNSEKNAGSVLRGAGDPSSAAQIVDELYERSRGTERSKRIANALALLKGYESRRGSKLVDVMAESKPTTTVAMPPTADTSGPRNPNFDTQLEAAVASATTKVTREQVAAGFTAMNQKVNDVEKQIPRLSAFVLNPDPSIASYRKA
jgi:hypothetical protein